MRLDFDARTRLLLVEIASRQLAVVWHGDGIKQHFSSRHVGVALGDELLDDDNHLRNIVSGARLVRGR